MKPRKSALKDSWIIFVLKQLFSRCTYGELILACISIICMSESYMKADRWRMGGDKLHPASANIKGGFSTSQLCQILRRKVDLTGSLNQFWSANGRQQETWTVANEKCYIKDLFKANSFTIRLPSLTDIKAVFFYHSQFSLYPGLTGIFTPPQDNISDIYSCTICQMFSHLALMINDFSVICSMFKDKNFFPITMLQ